MHEERIQLTATDKISIVTFSISYMCMHLLTVDISFNVGLDGDTLIFCGGRLFHHCVVDRVIKDIDLGDEVTHMVLHFFGIEGHQPHIFPVQESIRLSCSLTQSAQLLNLHGQVFEGGTLQNNKTKGCQSNWSW